MSDYGKRGGTGPNTGKKARKFREPTTGREFTKFADAVWFVVSQMDEEAALLVCAYSREDRARYHYDQNYEAGYEVNYITVGEAIT